MRTKPEEILLPDGHVVDPRSGGSRLASVLIRDGRIAFVGAADEASARAMAEPTVIDLDGAFLLPGLIEPHCHLTWMAFLKLGADCSPGTAPGIPELQALLRAEADSRPGPGWIYGSRYLEYGLREGRHPNRDDLDQAVGDRPCVLFHRSVHACVLNSAALAELGFRDDSPEPEAGILERDDHGRLTGILFEQPSFEVLESRMSTEIGSLPSNQRVELVEAASRDLAALGITTCLDAALRHYWLDTLIEALESGRLPIRVRALLDHRDGERFEDHGIDPGRYDRLRLSGVKIFADGGISSRTAAIRGRYRVPPFGSGILFFDDEELAALVEANHRRGRQIGVHAQGDRALESVISAFARAMEGDEGNPLGHRIEHAGAIDAEQLARVADLRLRIVTQPGFVASFGDGFVDAFGSETAERLFPIASMLRAGIPVAGSSDAPVTEPAPLGGIADAMLRKTPSGSALGPAERLDAAAALRLYTEGAALALGDEELTGSIEPGKAADLTILDRNPLECSGDEIAAATVLGTIVAGELVHQRAPGALTDEASAVR